MTGNTKFFFNLYCFSSPRKYSNWNCPGFLLQSGSYSLIFSLSTKVPVFSDRFASNSNNPGVIICPRIPDSSHRFFPSKTSLIYHFLTHIFNYLVIEQDYTNKCNFLVWWLARSLSIKLLDVWTLQPLTPFGRKKSICSSILVGKVIQKVI